MRSERYKTVVQMLEDPLTRICIEREFTRQNKKNYLCPPVKNSSGTRYAFYTFREVLRNGLPEVYDDSASGGDLEAEVFCDSPTDRTHWFSRIVYQGDVEIGPFDTHVEALGETVKFFQSEKFLILNKIPWTIEDTQEYPLGAGSSRK